MKRRLGGIIETQVECTYGWHSHVTKLNLEYDQDHSSKQTVYIANNYGEKFLKITSEIDNSNSEVIKIFNKEKELNSIKMEEDYSFKLTCYENFFTIALNKEIPVPRHEPATLDLFVFDYKGNELFAGKEDTRIAERDGKTKQ